MLEVSYGGKQRAHTVVKVVSMSFLYTDGSWVVASRNASLFESGGEGLA